ncbi:hypothetical protein KGF54_005447 [Candida jiufengensis]|uniref:uncharacterized protein n=1 Tax=Candida jiufengensis TaxID=497108 RepID=UPI002225585C|nr:uncharacterized protein KGF54_005447 [Candida jiufengensis]KAI5949570.1 hypothetical protein KGF54_005447 [Candida jiufengensis]
MSSNITDSNATYAPIISFIDLYLEDNQIEKTPSESNCNTILSDTSLPTPISPQETNENFNHERVEKTDKHEEGIMEEESKEEIREEVREEIGEEIKEEIKEESKEDKSKEDESKEDEESFEKYAQATIGRNFDLSQINFCNDEEDHSRKVEEKHLEEGKQDYEDTTSSEKLKRPFSERCKKFCKKHLPFLLSKETDEPEDILKVLFKTHHNISMPGYEDLDNKNKRTFDLNKKDFKKMNKILNNIYSPTADESNKTPNKIANKTSITNKVKNIFKKSKVKKSGKKSKSKSKSNTPPPKSILKNAQNVNYSVEKKNCKEADNIPYAQFWNKLNKDEAINKKREDDDYYFTPRLEQVRSYYHSIN